MNPVIRKTTIRNPADLSHLRWTLDTPEDYTFISEIYGDLHCPPEIFLMTDILNLLARKPELQKINSHISRNQGYKKSLSQDHTR